MKIYQLQELSKATDDFYEQVAIYKGISYDEAKYTVKISEIEPLRAEISRALQLPRIGTYRRYFWINGWPYKVPYSLSEMTAAQYMDLTTFIDSDIVQNLHNIITVMVKRKGNQPKFSDMVRMKVDAQVGLSMAVFFCKYWKMLNEAGQDFSQEVAKVVGLNKVGDGRLLYTEFSKL
jgi:hypothetical protein